MAERKFPRRPALMKMGEHARSAFLGAADGASSLPEPVGASRTASPNRVIKFRTDSFSGPGHGGGSTGKITLTYLPIDGSETVFEEDVGGSFRQGRAYGRAMFVAPWEWYRPSGSREMTVYVTGNVFVHYAYY